MKPNCLLLSILVLLIFPVPFFAQDIHLGFLSTHHLEETDKEVKAALAFLGNQNSISFDKILLSEISSPQVLQAYDLLWMHYSDTLQTAPLDVSGGFIKEYLNNGGKLLLTLEAFQKVNELGYEPQQPETRNKKIEDSGYGRIGGFHAFRSHPVFDGLNGGAYIFKPLHDTTVRITGYFDKNLPLNGAVVAVDWDYIFVRENSKLITEYWTGKGRILAVGAYTCFSAANANRPQLEKFITNSLHYLSSPDMSEKPHYWKFHEQMTEAYESEYPYFIERDIVPWEKGSTNPKIEKEKGDSNFWDMAGERMLMMGKEKGGIEEIWSFPFMAFRDYEAGIKFADRDSIVWLISQTPKIEITPYSFSRTYHINGTTLTETLATSIKKPLGIVNYKITGDESTMLFVKATSNLRLMWPYSENVLKALRYSFDINLTSFLISDESGDFNCMMGSNKEPVNLRQGQAERFLFSWYKTGNDKEYCDIEIEPTERFEVKNIFQFNLTPTDSMDIIFSASNEGLDTCINNYKFAMRSTNEVFKNTREHYERLLKNHLRIITPDTLFNEGYKWAIAATDKFFVNTPGLGISLVAGYSTTNTGWDGGHKISGRPGYGWYFGRDGEWSGFALLDYGDFEKVKSMLQMFGDFQDLNGKVFHEMSATGFVHYDAADATPLYIVLMGKYLSHSADTAFVQSQWPRIEKALAYCFSTDTDGDHLIENTAVGHGWVEGGNLFGSHTSLYLASCWEAALREAAYISSTFGNPEKTSFYEGEAQIVKQLINTGFWNKKENYFYHGKLEDGNFIETKTIMPAIPMLFGQIEKEKTQNILQAFAGNDFSTDWGCRIIGESNESYNPRGYHTGSVWPLFTGWVSLAEYKYGNPAQAYAHIMDNLLIYKDWGLGYVEEVLNGETYEPSGVCHHQCWSETMVLQPAISGMLGIVPDAVHHGLEFAPALPADWDSIKVKNIKVGKHLLDFSMMRKENQIQYTFVHSGPQALNLVFNPKLPKGTMISGIKISGNFGNKSLDPRTIPEFYILDSISLTYHIQGGISILPLSHYPKPGDKSKGPRIISEELNADTYTIIIEGKGNGNCEFQVYRNDANIPQIKGGEIIGSEGRVFTVKVHLPEGKQKYSRQKIEIYL
jgi:glycogen debranching enzyme